MSQVWVTMLLPVDTYASCFFSEKVASDWLLSFFFVGIDFQKTPLYCGVTSCFVCDVYFARPYLLKHGVPQLFRLATPPPTLQVTYKSQAHALLGRCEHGPFKQHTAFILF